MIINQNKISLITSQNCSSLRKSLREASKSMSKTQLMGAKVRFLTERDQEGSFEDFQSGRKIIDELPEVTCGRFRGRPSLYHHIFNFVSTEKHKDASRVKRRLAKNIVQTFNNQSQIEPWGTGVVENRSIYTHFLKKNTSEFIQSEASQRGYSLVIPSLEHSRGKSQKIQIFKRKAAKTKHEKIPKLNHGPSKSQIRRERSQINQLIRIEKKEIKDVRVNKIVINKSKFFHMERKSSEQGRITSSRIQPWGFSHYQNELQSF